MIFLVYLMNILENLHSFSATYLVVSGFAVFWIIMYSFIERKEVPDLLKRYLKVFFFSVLIALIVFVLTPTNVKHNMDMQYIRKNGELQKEVYSLRSELMKYKLRNGAYVDEIQ